MLTTTAIGSPDCPPLTPSLSRLPPTARPPRHGWLAWGIEAQEKRRSISFSSFLPTFFKARDSESGGTLDLVVASCQVRSKCVRWPRNEPIPPSAQVKYSDALGNAVECEHKNARIMPSGSLLNQYEVLLQTRLLKKLLVQSRETQDERRTL